MTYTFVGPLLLPFLTNVPIISLPFQQEPPLRPKLFNLLPLLSDLSSLLFFPRFEGEYSSLEGKSRS